MNKDERIEAQQRAMAEGMGISWDRYAARASAGVHTFQPHRDWNPRWYLRIEWRPRWKERGIPARDEDGGEAEAASLRHNQAILAAIPKTDPVVPDDVLTTTAAPYRREGRAVGFFSPFAISVVGMRGWTPVFDDEGRPVSPDGYLMMCEKPIPQATSDSAELYAPEWSRAGGPGDGDIVRLTWGVWIWRGVLALYRLTAEDGNPRRGIEFGTQRWGRDPNSVVLRFYRPPK